MKVIVVLLNPVAVEVRGRVLDLQVALGLDCWRDVRQQVLQIVLVTITDVLAITAVTVAKKSKLVNIGQVAEECGFALVSES